MKTTARILKQLHWLSLDVVGGAFASTAFACHVLHAMLPQLVWLALGLAVWVFYLSDHWLDAQTEKIETKAERRTVFLRYRKQFSAFILLLCFFLLVLVFFLPLPVIYFGFGLAGFNLLYFLLVRYGRKKRLTVPKELFVAIIYTAGTWGAPLLFAKATLATGQWASLSLFCIIVLQEGMLAAWFDFEQDEHENHPSFVRWLGYALSQRIVFFLTGIVFTVSTFLFMQDAFTIGQGAILCSMSLTLSVVIGVNQYFSRNERFRMVGELVFLLPALIVFA